jgi:hypothetical protein
MRNGKCPSCKKVIQLQEKIKVQELVSCPHCNSILELVRLFPPTLDWAEDPVVNHSHRSFTKGF